MLAARASNTHFLNVDLDVYSKRDLRPLVDCLERKVHVLFVGRERRKFSAHLEIAGNARSADATIRAFCKLIGDLPRGVRKIWDAATLRSFSVGVHAEIGSPVRDFRIKPATVTAVSTVGAEIVLTVYAPKRENPRS